MNWYRKSNAFFDRDGNARNVSMPTPICSYCKKVRDVDGNWFISKEVLEGYDFQDITAGVCPPCKEKAIKEIGI